MYESTPMSTILPFVKHTPIHSNVSKFSRDEGRFLMGLIYSGLVKIF